MSDILNVNPNRMELMKLRKRLSLAQRGHRLLKDKQDELMDRFTSIIEEVKKMRDTIEGIFTTLKMTFLSVRTNSNTLAFKSLLISAPVRIELKGSNFKIMNLIIPEVNIDVKENVDLLGNWNLSSMMPGFIRDFLELFKKIVSLLNSERMMYAVADELQKVRRRVNALEYIFIPKLENTIKYISMQLEEMERENITRLMKIKEIVRSRN